jgi:hypothetical protein
MDPRLVIKRNPEGPKAWYAAEKWQVGHERKKLSWETVFCVKEANALEEKHYSN